MRMPASSPSARLFAVGALLATVASGRAESPAPPTGGDRKAGECVIVEYKGSGDSAYTWYYCPSSRIYTKGSEVRITDFDAGIETRVLGKDKKVQRLPIAVKQEWRRAELARRESISITPTGKTDVIAGVPAGEYLYRVTYREQPPREVRQWFAADMPVPGRDKAIAADVDAEARRTPAGVFLRSDGVEATSVRKGAPPEALLAVPADYEKVRWSVEKKGWVPEAEGEGK